MESAGTIRYLFALPPPPPLSGDFWNKWIGFRRLRGQNILGSSGMMGRGLQSEVSRLLRESLDLVFRVSNLAGELGDSDSIHVRNREGVAARMRVVFVG